MPLRHHGVPLSQGTLTDGLQRLAGLLEPVMPALYERQMREKLFHGDETRWEVFEEVEGKTGHRWYLWVMQSASVVFYRMAPGRGAEVPKAHCAKLHKDLVDVVLVCDRYSAYKCLAKDRDAMLISISLARDQDQQPDAATLEGVTADVQRDVVRREQIVEAAVGRIKRQHLQECR